MRFEEYEGLLSPGERARALAHAERLKTRPIPPSGGMRTSREQRDRGVK